MKLNLPNILIVDDDKRILELIDDYLSKNNFRVNVASNSLEAREKIENIEFDLIILDIMMPGETGLKLTDSLKKNNFKTPILLLSALGEPEDRIKGLEWCEVGEHFVNKNEMWEDFADCMNCVSEKEYLEHINN